MRRMFQGMELQEATVPFENELHLLDGYLNEYVKLH